MPGLKIPLDEFIEKSQLLIAARPETTRVTTTYTHSVPRPCLGSANNNANANNANANDNSSRGSSQGTAVHVKTFDPISGACFRTSLTRVNELGRVMMALGPQGVSSVSGGTSGSTTNADAGAGASASASGSASEGETAIQGLAAAMLGEKSV
ncbi:uncharacterized protein SAPINGB_P002605 [Magnusiomyces paraingens]|uniref:SRP9 domain-containing protein n=1 Tax=Magnusiomyces paraingens TaxID=2606893 RepID=A0A5E8BF25_9ASCO|nr:uncharacterized protein SAPINGB_P002605 [Saprochaete ingens]VVT50109.1 unnamed protein product [Saprochaete ingens]